MKILSMPGKSWKNKFMFGILFTAVIKARTKIETSNWTVQQHFGGHQSLCLLHWIRSKNIVHCKTTKVSKTFESGSVKIDKLKRVWTLVINIQTTVHNCKGFYFARTKDTCHLWLQDDFMQVCRKLMWLDFYCSCTCISTWNIYLTLLFEILQAKLIQYYLQTEDLQLYKHLFNIEAFEIIPLKRLHWIDFVLRA